MNSQTLKENGFTDFIPLKNLPFTSLPYNKSSIIVIADPTVTNKPASGILYIGKSKRPVKRIFGGYIAGYGGKTAKKIHDLLFNENFIEKVAISWMLSDDLKTAQKNLLEDFKKTHGEYPKWNTKKVQTKPKPASKIVKAPPTRKPSKRSAKPA